MKIALGLGCDRNTPLATVETAIGAALVACSTTWNDVQAVASIDLKADEPAFLQLAAEQGWTIRFYAAQALAQVDVPSPSETVRKHTGTPSVSEAAALLAAQPNTPNTPNKTNLIIEKHRYRGPDGRNATVSIARIPE